MAAGALVAVGPLAGGCGGSFELSTPEMTATILVPAGEPECVRLAAADLAGGVERITGRRADVPRRQEDEPVRGRGADARGGRGGRPDDRRRPIPLDEHFLQLRMIGGVEHFGEIEAGAVEAAAHGVEVF